MRTTVTAGLLAAATCLALPVAAQTLIQTPTPSPRNEAGVGQHYRATVAEAQRRAMNGEPQAAITLLAPVVAYCDAQQQRPNLGFVSVSTAAQYDRYMRTQGGAPVEWLDMACTHSYYYTGYALVEQRKFEQALPYLSKAVALAPYFPDALNERGAALNQLGRLDEAEQNYRQVLALSQEDSDAAYMAPLAWRGIGYGLIEKRDWAAARAAYETSLALDPGNSTALNELEFIRRNASK
jgi:tetratricopeptide (TPR) repeat protein